MQMSISSSTVLIVFVGAVRIRCLKQLRRGFRHCFVVIIFDAACITFDPLSHQTFLGYAGELDPKRLARSYQRLGFTVIQSSILAAPSRLAPVRPFTCVEAVKRVLGMHLPRVFTPWQLFRVVAAVERKLFLDARHAPAYSARHEGSTA